MLLNAIIPTKKKEKKSKTVISKLLSSTGPLYIVWANHKWTGCIISGPVVTTGSPCMRLPTHPL